MKRNHQQSNLEVYINVRNLVIMNIIPILNYLKYCKFQLDNSFIYCQTLNCEKCINVTHDENFLIKPFPCSRVAWLNLGAQFPHEDELIKTPSGDSSGSRSSEVKTRLVRLMRVVKTEKLGWKINPTLSERSQMLICRVTLCSSEWDVRRAAANKAGHTRWHSRSMWWAKQKATNCGESKTLPACSLAHYKPQSTCFTLKNACAPQPQE